MSKKKAKLTLKHKKWHWCKHACILYSTENERYVDGDMWLATTFAPTPLMSTYLLAFTVNEFKEEFSEYDNKRISVRCCYNNSLYFLLHHIFFFLFFFVKNDKKNNSASL